MKRDEQGTDGESDSEDEAEILNRERATAFMLGHFHVPKSRPGWF